MEAASYKRKKPTKGKNPLTETLRGETNNSQGIKCTPAVGMKTSKNTQKREAVQVETRRRIGKLN